MKLSRIFTVFGIVALFSLASCKKDQCYTCTHDTEPAQTLCEGSGLVGSLDLTTQIIELETQGFVCTEN